jgi:hypothetical protein
VTPYYTFIFLLVSIAALPIDKNLKNYIALIASVAFVGLKYETGFDWTVYKDMFFHLRNLDANEFISNIDALSLQFKQEHIFVLYVAFASKIFPNYEMFTLFNYAFYVISLYFVSQRFNCEKFSYAIIPIHLFLMFTLEFSTLRQMIAIGFLNFATFFYLRNAYTRTVITLLFAVGTQVSAGIYLVAILPAVILSGNRAGRALLALAPIAFIVFAVPAYFYSDTIIDKLTYYLQSKDYNYNILEIAFSSCFFAFSFVALLISRSTNVNEARRFLWWTCILLIAMAVIMFPFTTVRNRISYVIVPFLSFYLFSYPVRFRYRSVLQYCYFLAGLVFFTGSLLKPSSVVLRPYQNYLVHWAFQFESDGRERQQSLVEMRSD